jgi:hypothetical protein
LTFATPLVATTAKIVTRYFLKSFTLSANDATATWGFGITARYSDGLAVFINGNSCYRMNVPSGILTDSTPSTLYVINTNPNFNPNVVTYYPYGPTRACGAAAIAGTNWVAAAQHANGSWAKNYLFDMSLTRYVIQPCPNGGPSTSCVRNPPVDTVFIPLTATFTYSDATMAIPPTNWVQPAFSDNLWPSGSQPLGSIGSWSTTAIKLGADVASSRTTYYFRTSFTANDGACYVSLNLTLACLDGAVVYINGIEAARFNMPSGPITSTTPASGRNGQWMTALLSTGWLQNGVNVVAVELHQSTIASTIGAAYWFRLTLTGQREGVNCSPLPP